mmetsp:Transcript_19652/g.45717  ORF Transcript_19652/g.45717 Transcript_19652/m.45717 type:complete len:233 (+) Transcript_19652:2289-2987(+)
MVVFGIKVWLVFHRNPLRHGFLHLILRETLAQLWFFTNKELVIISSFVPSIASNLCKSMISEGLSKTRELALEVVGHNVVREVWSVVNHKCLSVGCPRNNKLMSVTRSVTKHDTQPDQKVVLLKRSWDLRFRLHPNQIWSFSSHKLGVTVNSIFQLRFLIDLRMVGRRSHESPSTKLLLEGTVGQRIKIKREYRVHESGWVVNRELLSIRRPRNNILLSLFLGVCKQRVQTT